jgi:hypothetical protein
MKDLGAPFLLIALSDLLGIHRLYPFTAPPPSLPTYGARGGIPIIVNGKAELGKA